MAKNCGSTDFGNTLRDNVLKFQLDNEVANNLSVVVSGTEVTLTLTAKSGALLGGGTFDLAGGLGIASVELDNEQQKLVFTFSNGTKKYCDLSDLYDEIPTKTSDLTNDGDGNSPFATQSYVDTHGGKIDIIKLNGTALPIVDKTVNIEIPDQLDTNVKLSSRLVTYYNIGAITTASGTNPVELGKAGDSIRQVLNKITQMEEIQPNKTEPGIDSFTLASNASDEVGTSISSINYTVNTNPGSYQFGPATGVTWSNFNFGEGIDKPTATGTLTLTTPYVVGTSAPLSYTCTGTHSGGVVAKTNLGNDSNPVVQIAAGTKTAQASFSKASKVYAYTNITSSSTTPTTGGVKRSEVSTFRNNGEQLSYSAGDYIYFFTDMANRTVQTNVLGQWADVETTRLGLVTITLSNGSQYGLQGYRIGPFGASGSDKYRV